MEGTELRRLRPQGPAGFLFFISGRNYGRIEDNDRAELHRTRGHVEAMGRRDLLDGAYQRRSTGRIWSG